VVGETCSPPLAFLLLSTYQESLRGLVKEALLRLTVNSVGLVATSYPFNFVSCTMFIVCQNAFCHFVNKVLLLLLLHLLSLRLATPRALHWAGEDVA